jgi:uncharacterized membrane protein YfcA
VTTYLLTALGAAIGVAAGILGAGPSILTILVLTHVGGLELGRAIATALVVVALMSLISVVPYVRSRSVVWRAALGFGTASMIGAFVGGRLSRLLPARALLVIFLLAMIVASFAMLGRRRAQVLDGAPKAREQLAVLAFGGLVVGGVTGLVGLGGGFAVVPLLVVFARTPMRDAIGTSILIIAMNTLAGLLGHLPHPPVDWRIAGTLGVAESLGGLCGARIAPRINAETLRRAFACLMLAGAIVMLAHTLLGWRRSGTLGGACRSVTPDVQGSTVGGTARTGCRAGAPGRPG